MAMVFESETPVDAWDGRKILKPALLVLALLRG